MRKKLAALAASTMFVLVLGTGTAGAVSPAQAECEAAGGTYTKAPGSTATCVYPERTKDVNGNAYGTATQDTTTGQGNLNNRTQNECTGNQGQCKKG